MKKIYTFFCSMVLLLTFGQLSATEFDVVNTGSNMTVFVTPGTSMTGDLSNINQIGIFYTNDSGELACAGVSSFDADGNFQITVWGSEAGADNGMAEGEEMIWLAEANNGFTYNVTAAFQADAMANYTLNSISFVSALDFVLDETSMVEGCMDGHYVEYNADANIHDPSQCITWKVNGCTDEGYEEYDPAATFDDGSCLTEVTACSATAITMGGGSWISETSFVIADCDGNELASGAGAAGEYCVELPENYSITMNDSYGDGWNGNILNIGGVEYTLDGAEEVVVIGSCGEVAVPGCTDETATNYNADATEDDGSCEYEVACEGTEITMGGGSWISETSFVIADCDGNELASGAGAAGEYCVELPENYSITMNDSYGDGWNGNILNIGGVEYTLDGAEEVVVIGSCGEVAVPGCTDETASNYNADATEDDGSCEYTVAGCTDATATNYNADATEDDGSCEYEVSCEGTELTVNMMDSYGDGWNGNTLTIAGQSVTLESGAEGTATVCVDMSACNTIEVGGGSWGSEISWSIGDLEGSVGSFFIGEGCVTGCSDELATNYNADADIVDNSTCEYALVQGCTDATACNFDEAAEEDNGSCEYPVEGFDCEGNCISGSLVTVDGGSYQGEVSWSILDCSGAELAAGGAPFSGCVDFTESYTISMVDSYGDGWNGNVMTIGEATYTIDSGAEGTADMGCAIAGCTDDTATNYNADATEDDGSCEYALVQGCTDATACNFDEAAEEDNGSCEYPVEGFDCEGNCVAGVTMTLGGGSWISETSFSIVGCDGTVVFEGGGAALSTCVELPEGYTITMNDAYGDGWNGNVLTIGDATYTIESGAELVVDMGCAVAGCTDETATNYNVDATEDDGSCEYALVQGCTDASACNFDEAAEEDNGSCEYPAEGFDCEGNCTSGDALTVNLYDSYGDGWNGNTLTIAGQSVTLESGAEGTATVCVDMSACNTIEVGGGSWGSEISWSIGDLEGSVGSFEIGACAVLGCTDEAADNFNADANEDDGSCTYTVVGCTDANYVEYNAEATQDDGSCTQTWQEALDAAIADANAADAATEAAEALVADLEGQLEAALANQEDGVSQSDVDAVQAQLNDANDALASSNEAADAAEAQVSDLEAQLADALANQEDGVSQSDVDAVQADLDAANAALAAAEALVADLEAQLADALANQEDGVSQSDVDAVQADLDAANAALDAANATIADLEAQLADALANQEDGVSQADVDAAYADGAASVTPEDGVSQADVDAAYADGAASVTPEDGVSQADVDAAVAAADAASSATIADLQAQLDEALANAGGGSCEQIFIDIVEGWNILGYTLPYGQDVVATVADIVDNILIVKNNNAQVYWPEFGFNGIGDFVPGQGYQVKTTAAISAYTWPDVDGQRIELTPTVPTWAIDMDADIHPNDIRSIVKVVNMLGQEVNVADQFSGEVLLYLYNDGSVEKKIVR